MVGGYETPPEPSDMPRKDVPNASVEVRKALLQQLGAPKGSVTIARRPSPTGDVIVVRMTASNVVPSNRRLPAFGGFDVDYEVVTPLKIGTW